MKANIKIQTDGARGKSIVTTHTRNLNLKIDSTELDQKCIYMESTYGGNNPEVRENTLINIYTNKEPVFTGTFDQLVAKLKSVK